MFCPPEYPYQMATEYQNFESQQAYPGQTLQAYNTSISAYSPPSTQDRPSPSFRIEDILLQNKVMCLLLNHTFHSISSKISIKSAFLNICLRYST